MRYEKFGNLQPRDVFMARGQYYIRTGIVTADPMFKGQIATFSFDDLVIVDMAVPQTTENREPRTLVVYVPVQVHRVDISVVFA